jgi:predicted RNA-binding Zn-ribbon protein involved in translation (DUF1610 family)
MAMSEQRLIDANALLNDGIRVSFGYDANGLLLIPMRDVRRSIEGAPTVDAEPVVHGRWEYSFGSYSTPKCSCCGWHIPYSEDSVLDARNYCPNCGAKMDEKEEQQ